MYALFKTFTFYFCSLHNVTQHYYIANGSPFISSAKYLGARHYLKQLVTIPECVGAAHGSLGQDGPDVVMGPDLLTILHIHCKCIDQ